ncbi:hypothetical protein [Flavobacterium sp.]|uniref:hypothetical protein n=1 Tax=Flavobacterium sp. TaxID=239 RepID=UPI003A8C966A
MKSISKIILVLLPVLFVNCRETEKGSILKTSETPSETKEIIEDNDSLSIPLETNTVERKTIKPLSHPNKALVLTGELELYNKNRKQTGLGSNVYSRIVTTDSVSELRYGLDKTDDICEKHSFVKVSHPDVKGWVYGKDVYEYDMSRDTTFTVNDVQFKIIPTKNFSVGPFNDKGLTFCGANNPMVLYNSKFDKEEYIPLENKKEFYYDSDYLMYDNHDGWIDSLKGASLVGDTLTLNIYREYQEGSANIIFEIYLSKFGSKAIIKEIIEHEPEF